MGQAGAANVSRAGAAPTWQGLRLVYPIRRSLHRAFSAAVAASQVTSNP
jgi:hypothetical protein